MSVRKSLGGFPEWTPQGQMVQSKVLKELAATFELYGFRPLQTRALEPIDWLTSKGETSKEVYLVNRYDRDGDSKETGLGLRFDLTVPLARFVTENAGTLPFPYRRYQIGPVWRGERPQAGRYREFIQADIDIVGRSTLPNGAEAEVAATALDALTRLNLGRVTMRLNNRKVLEGFLTGLGIKDVTGTLRLLDKLDKVGVPTLLDLLVTSGLSQDQADACLALASIKTTDESFVARVQALGVQDPLLDEGLNELLDVFNTAKALYDGSWEVDLSIARGLDYYTGTVFESTLEGLEDSGSICSGGRYDNLVQGGKATYPGVGISVGVSRILGLLLNQGKLSATRSVPTCVLVAFDDDNLRGRALDVARTLRLRNIPTEVASVGVKMDRQVKYANEVGIPYVWFIKNDTDEVRDLNTRTQEKANAASWTPAADLWWPTVVTDFSN